MRLALTVVLAFAGVASATEPPLFTPDPLSVQRYGPAYRYPQAGWIVLHVEGEPYERGFQHGRLMAAEIAAYVKSFALQQSAKAPSDGWEMTRTLVNALFLRRFHPEFLQEMKGIAEGATEAGAKFDGRGIDLVDIAAVNCWAEIETLPSALYATPTGLEGLQFRKPQPQKMPEPPMGHCSAFAATGPATADGKIVFGHITMFGLYPGNFFNVWLDVKPTKGRRVLMQTYPGGIQSGMDYYINDAGLMVTETTIRQTRFNIHGFTVASRIRQALQYSENIDQVVESLTRENNGLYTNEWLIGDANTNEIAMLQLGTGKHHLSRSSKNEWFGGTPGFYWGCNNTKDIEVRLETLLSVSGRPANMVWRPSERDRAWQKLYREHQGKIDGAFARKAFTTPPLAAYHSIDAKYTTSDLCKALHSQALFGPPLGRTWEPTHHEREHYPDIRPLVTHPWTLLHAEPPLVGSGHGVKPMDLAETVGAYGRAPSVAGRPVTVPAWHGTIIPKSDADLWFASAFAEFEPLVALERKFREENNGGDLNPAQRMRLALERNRYRVGSMAADTPLAEIKANPEQIEWHERATGRGVLVLHELRQLVGADAFDKAMNEFGTRHAGTAVTAEQFRLHLLDNMHPKGDDQRRQATGQRIREFFDVWVKGKDGVHFELADVKSASPPNSGTTTTTTGVVKRKGPNCDTVLVTAESELGEEYSVAVKFDGDTAKFTITTSKPPARLVVDKYLEHARAGSAVSVRTFWDELPSTMIVYGTSDEAEAQRDAAEALQRAIRAASANHTVAIRSDAEVTEEELKNRHLILIGRPDTNRLVRRFAEALPVRFGHRSIRVNSDVMANTRSGVICAAASPLAKSRALIVVAGLGAEGTRAAALQVTQQTHAAADVVLLPQGHGAIPLVMPSISHELK